MRESPYKPGEYMARFGHLYQRELSDEVIRKFWKDAGGQFHGPNVETAIIPEDRLFGFVRDLVEAAVLIASQADAGAKQ